MDHRRGREMNERPAGSRRRAVDSRIGAKWTKVDVVDHPPPNRFRRIVPKGLKMTRHVRHPRTIRFTSLLVAILAMLSAAGTLVPGGEAGALALTPAGSASTNYDWARLVLTDGGWPLTYNNVTVITDWMTSEEPTSNWWDRNNPLNNGYGSGGGAGLGSYANLAIAAYDVAANLSYNPANPTSNTGNSGLGYAAIVADFAASAPVTTTAKAIQYSYWAGGQYSKNPPCGPVKMPSVTCDGAKFYNNSGTATAVPTVAAPTTAWSGPAQALAPSGTLVTLAPSSDGLGYWLAASSGYIGSFGDANFLGDVASTATSGTVAAMVATPDGLGYWLVTTTGRIENFGDARFFGSTGGVTNGQSFVGIASTATGLGYWLLASNGSVQAYGDAVNYGSPPTAPNGTYTAITATPSGLGYWLLTGTGRIANFGNATFVGSTFGNNHGRTYDALAATSNGKGYWMLTTTGAISNFGTAHFFGSGITSGMSATTKAAFTTIAATTDDQGYWIATGDGHVGNFGDASFYGSLATQMARQPS